VCILCIYEAVRFSLHMTHIIKVLFMD
jgi:hypothetical protein